MPLSKVGDIRKLNNEELNKSISSTKRELFELRFQKATGRLKQTHLFKHARHRLAQLMSVERERQPTPSKRINYKNSKAFATENFRVKEREVVYLEERQKITQSGTAIPQSKSEYKDSMSKIDSYILYAFDLLKRGLKPEGIGIFQTSEGTYQLPMLIQVENDAWRPNTLPDYDERSRMGRFIVCLGSRRTIELLQKDDFVLSVEASRRGLLGDQSSRSESQEHSNSVPNLSSIEVIKADVIHQYERGDRAIIAIVDTGIDVLHDAFLGEDGRTRIIAFWDLQNDREYSADDINQFITSGNAPMELRDLAERNGGHGTHVASVAAGQRGRFFLGGVAPSSKIIVVRVDENQVLGDSYTYQKALNYIEKISIKNDNLPVVVNISSGLEEGGRDGRSGLEQTFEFFLENGQKPGYIVVKSAGNKGLDRQHAKLNLRPGTSGALVWGNLNTRSEDEIEIWFHQGNQIIATLTAPNGDSSGETGFGLRYLADGSFSNGNEYSIRYRESSPRNQDSQFSVLVSKGSAECIEEGRWKLKLEIISKKHPRDGSIHAWINGCTNSRISFLDHVDREVTLTIPGTADHVITVAAMKDAQQVCDTSSAGLTRDGREKPDVAAPGEDVNGACAGTDSGVCPKSGTSIAAPHVSGAIALVLSAREKRNLSQFSSRQIRSYLQRTTANYTGTGDPLMGHGLLNVENFFNECGEFNS